jgi:N-acetylglutamate synthase-like GNAT family acetyltransferase
VEVTFRKATLQDVEGIIKLCDECFNEKSDLKYAKNMFKKTEDDPNNIYLIGLINDEIVAHSKITIIPTMYEDMNTYSILNHVCVKPELRRKKVATKMLNEITKICEEKKCKAIKLWSKNFREDAHSCYNKYGFELIDSGFFSKKLGGEK